MDSVSRKQVYDWLHRCLIGPANANVDSLNGICPLERFQSGILFPISVGEFGADPADEDSDDDDDAPDDGDKAGAEAAGLSRPKRRVVPPSSVGFSFFVCGDRIEIELIPRAVCYQCGEERNERGEWKIGNLEPCTTRWRQRGTNTREASYTGRTSLASRREIRVTLVPVPGVLNAFRHQ